MRSVHTGVLAMQRKQLFGYAAISTCLLASTGCPNPNTYGTPRTVPAGHISHSIAVEAIGAHAGGASVDLPTAPTYTMRIGAAENLDVGLRVANLTTLGADLKWNFLKGPFDMAIAPGAQFFYYSTGTSSGSNSASASISGTYLHLPLLLGINLTENVTLVPTVGIMYGAVGGSSSVSSGDGSNDSVKASSNTGVIGRFGFGADFRVSAKFALHPEITIMKGFRERAEGVVYLAGLGFNFGTLPDYSDVK
jgi:hypothetical protein